MHPYPHHYFATASAEIEGKIALRGDDLPELPSMGPPEFGGPGGYWSPETLFVAAVADCFILTFRAIARNSKLHWEALRCEAEGILDRVENVTQFTEIQLRATLRVPAGVDEAKAMRLLEKAERGCLITNSLKPPCHLQATIEIAT